MDKCVTGMVRNWDWAPDGVRGQRCVLCDGDLAPPFFIWQRTLRCAQCPGTDMCDDSYSGIPRPVDTEWLLLCSSCCNTWEKIIPKCMEMIAARHRAAESTRRLWWQLGLPGEAPVTV